MTPLIPPSESGTSQELFQALKLLLLQGVLWFIGVQLLIGVPGYLEASAQEYLTSRPIDYAHLFVVADIWHGLAVFIWSIPLYAAITWLLFRSRFRMAPEGRPLWRWAAGATLFPVLGWELWFSPSSLQSFTRPPLMWLYRHAPFGLTPENWGWIVAELFLAIVGSLTSALVFFDAKMQLRIWGLLLIAILVPGTLIFGCGKALGIARDWRASPSDEEYAVYSAIAQRDFKKFGVPTKLAPDCFSPHSNWTAPGRDSGLLHLVNLLGAKDAFINMQQRQKLGCKLARRFGQDSLISVLPGGDLTEKMSRDWRGALHDLASDPNQDGIGIFSRVGFSPDRKRAFVARIGLRRYKVKGDVSVTINTWPTILTKTESGWGVDFGSEADEWQLLGYKTTDPERLAFIEEVRIKRGLLSKD